MQPNAIYNLGTIDLLKVFQPVSDGQDRYTLSGQYRLRGVDVDVEIELIDGDTCRRSLVYIRSGQTLYLTIPFGYYRFWHRYLSEPQAGAVLEMTRLSVLQSMSLYANKAWQLVRQGRFLDVLKWRPSALRNDTITGLRLGVGNTYAQPLIAREAFVPGPVDQTFQHVGVSIIIPTKTRLDLLSVCIESLKLITAIETELIIIDNGATDAAMLIYLQTLSLRKDVRIIRRDEPFNFSRLCNAGAVVARYELLLFLNDDIEALDSQWLSIMADYASRPGVGVVGARLLYADRTLQHAGIASNLVPGPGHPWRGVARDVWENHPLLTQPGEVDAVTGACLMIRRDVFERANGFDEAAFAVTLNDVDLCLRVRETGLRIIYVPEATLLHKESQSRKPDYDPSQQKRRQSELAAFLARHPKAARQSRYYPEALRRDTDAGLPI